MLERVVTPTCLAASSKPKKYLTGFFGSVYSSSADRTAF